MSIRHPVRVLVVAAVLTIAAAFGLPRLELRTDGHALVPDSSSEVAADRGIRKQFDVRDPIAVVIDSDHPDGIFNPDSLRRIQELTAAMRALDDVRPHDVTSLATERGFRRESGLMAFRGLLEPFPDTPEQLDPLRADLRKIGLYEGTLVSFDGRSAAILVDTPPEADRAALVHRIERLAAASDENAQPGRREGSAVLGAPVAEALLGHHVLADLGVPRAFLDAEGVGNSITLSGRRVGMVPISIVVMGMVFLLAFHRWTAALLPLAEIASCLAIVFGVMGWIGVPIYLTTVVIPVILAAVGAADEIHIFHRYLELGPGGDLRDTDHRRLVGRVMDEMAHPVAVTSITTAIAFLSFTLSPLAPVRAFGFFTALGVMVCMVFSLAVIPALLIVLGPRRFVARGRTGSPDPSAPIATFPVRWVGFVGRHRRAVFLVTVIVVLASLGGVRRLEVQDSWLDGFAPDSAFARATRSFDRQYLGSHRLQLTVEVGAVRLDGEVSEASLARQQLRVPRTTLTPERLAGSWVRLFRLGAGADPDLPHREWTTWIENAHEDGDEFVLEMPASGGSARAWLHPQTGERLGFEVWSDPWINPSVLKRVDALETFLGERSGIGGVMGPARYLKTVSFMLHPENGESRRLPEEPGRGRVLWSDYGMVRGVERLRQVVDHEARAALVSIFLEGADYTGTARLLDEIRDYEHDHLTAHGIALTVGGDVAVSQALIEAVVTTQVRSVLLSLVGVLLVAALLNRSWLWGLYCVLPPAFAVLISFAMMGWARIPLGVATSMFAGMTLGIGVDYAIHLLARYRLAARRDGLRGETAMGAALSTTGPAILIDALAVGLGFGVLTLSQVPANARLGGLLVASVLACLGATLVLVPALLARESP